MLNNRFGLYNRLDVFEHSIDLDIKYGDVIYFRYFVISKKKRKLISHVAVCSKKTKKHVVIKTSVSGEPLSLNFNVLSPFVISALKVYENRRVSFILDKHKYSSVTRFSFGDYGLIYLITSKYNLLITKSLKKILNNALLLRIFKLKKYVKLRRKYKI